MSFKNAEPSGAASSLHPRWDHEAQIILPSSVRRLGAKRPRLLLVEDEQPFRELLRDFLTAEGYEVQAAPDGRGGLSWMEENDVDLVVTDLCMPEVDGMELLMTIRKSSPEIPVIAMSGGVGGEMAGMLRAASLLGARRALGKPFSLQQLAAAVRESLTEMP